MFNRVLVPLDGSELAERAIVPAMTLAAATRGSVLLLHSMTLVHMALPEFAGEYDWHWPVGSRERSRQQAQAYLERIKARHGQPPVTLETRMVEGDEAGMIVDSAESSAVDLIVLSPHGRSGVRPGAIGTVAERVLHHAPCPVLLVRDTAPVDHVLVLLDGSALAERILAPAFAAARQFDADVTLLRVNEPLLPHNYHDVATEWITGDTYGQMMRTRAGDLCAYLEQVAERYRPLGFTVATRVESGPAADAILQAVHAGHYDLVAMTTHGRSGLRRWLYGSVTGKVLRQTDRSLLIVRPPHGGARY